ncbi:MAG: hypothetical protein M1828_001333 [Chrysothrix sp. TS-e1954]|nr:MAG: hypothetical protein M1828_001333 [Chrysothrix sp. TS-e1954]
MTENDVDPGSLTEDQQQALQQFTSVTDQDLATAVPLLRRSEWNVQIAIARFFDGEPAGSPSPPPPPEVVPPTSSRRQEVLLNGFSNGVSRRSRLEPAPRIVAASSLFDRPAGILASILLTPLNIIYTIITRFATLFRRLFPFLPRLLDRNRTSSSSTPQLAPQASRTRFLQDFRAQYDPDNRLPLTETNYARAFDTAKQDLHFLLVVPLSPEHDDTPSFVRQSLLSPLLVNFVRDASNNLKVWVGSVADTEPYQVANALSARSFPFAALIAHTPSVSSTAMSVIARLEQPSDVSSPEAFLAKIEAAMIQHGEGLQSARAQRTEQQASRDLRDQQNSAYERSLATDRARAQAKRDAERVKKDAEKAEQDQSRRLEDDARKRQQWKRWRASRLEAEPENAKEGVRVSIRLPDGTRVIRRFVESLNLEEVYAFVECYDEIIGKSSEQQRPVDSTKPKDFDHAYRFRLVSPMPREVYDLEGQSGTIRERIGRSGNLIVEKADDYN